MSDQDRLVTQLWFDPGFGASGDMMLGALIGLGASPDRIRQGLEALAIEGWSLGHESVLRGSLSADRALVTAPGGSHHRSWSSIDQLLADRPLPDRVKAGARSTFRRLGEVEAGIHQVSIDEVHFHEVGALDAIVDIVGSWLALDLLAVSTVGAGPVGLGRGTVEAAHGRLPIPAPATAELLRGAKIHSLDVETETVTPTGAALLMTMVDEWGPIPSGTLVDSSRGAGGRNPDRYPNVLSAYLVAGQANAVQPPPGTKAATRTDAVLLTTNLDDVTAEIVGLTMERCLAAGADDAWTVPIVMKKSRPGYELNVLISASLMATVQNLIFSETGTLGIRSRVVAKDVLDRSFTSILVRGHKIRIKIGPYGAKPEHEDVKSAAEALAMTARQVAAEAMAKLDQRT